MKKSSEILSVLFILVILLICWFESEVNNQWFIRITSASHLFLLLFKLFADQIGSVCTVIIGMMKHHKNVQKLYWSFVIVCLHNSISFKHIHHLLRGCSMLPRLLISRPGKARPRSREGRLAQCWPIGAQLEPELTNESPGMREMSVWPRVMAVIM